MVSNDKNPWIPGKKEKSILRSSAAEYLTFVAASGNSESIHGLYGQAQVPCMALFVFLLLY